LDSWFTGRINPKLQTTFVVIGSPIMQDYIQINRAYWDARVDTHADSDFYQM